MARKKAKKKAVRIKQDGTPAKNNAGRPVEYHPSMCQEMIDFFSVDPLVEVERIVGTDREGEPIVQKIQEVNKFPTLAAFALKLGKSKQTILEWAKIYPEFSDALHIAKGLQESFIVECGMKGKSPPSFAAFMLKNVAGYDDKKTVEHQGSEEKPLAVKAVDVNQRIKQLKDVN